MPEIVPVRVLEQAPEIRFGTYKITVSAQQTEGQPVSCGIYLSIADNGTGGYVNIGSVTAGSGEGSYTLTVNPDPTAPAGPKYVTVTIGVGLFDPYDYTAKFTVKAYIETMELFTYSIDMRTAPYIILTFTSTGTAPGAPPPAAGVAPAAAPAVPIIGIFPFIFGLFLAIIGSKAKR